MALLMACAEGQPETGAQIEVVNGDAPVPRYLLFDWLDDERTLVSNRRVPEKGFLNQAATPLAVVRIASSAGGAQRRIVVRGMVDEQQVSLGSGSVRIMQGSWQTAMVTLEEAPDPLPDGGAPDGSPNDGEDPPDGELPDGDPGAGASDLAAPEGQPVPPDAGLPEVAPDTLPPPDLLRDVAPEAPPTGAVSIAASADSYVEQGATNSGMNNGKVAFLEVKSQAGADNNRIAYLRFPLAAITGTPAINATLRLFGKTSGGTNSDSAFAVIDDTWTETAITWNNKPALGTRQASVAINATAQYRDWNVTAIVKSQQAAGRPTVNLAVSMDADTANAPDVFNSREAASNPPLLVITR